MKGKFKKLSALLISAAMLMGLSGSALAATNSDKVTSLPDNETERVLNIHKYSPVNENGTNGDGTALDSTSEELTGRKPLANVEFDIYKVAEIGSEFANKLPEKAPATVEGVKALGGDGTLITTVKTDIEGLAVFKPAEYDLTEDYVYYVVEKDNSAVTEKSDPFFVSVPYTDPDGDGWLYTVNVYPKNNIEGAPAVDKDVYEVGNKDYGVNVNTEFNWIIRGSIPSDIGRPYVDDKGNSLKKYVFTDTFDEKITYVSSTVKLYDKAGTEETVLVVNDDYTIVEPAEDRTLTISLTAKGMEKVAASLGNGNEKPEIRVYVAAKLNEKAAMGEKVYNDVTLDYTNSVGVSYESKVDVKPEVHTGGFKLLKYDGSNSEVFLGGAEFKVAASLEDAENGKFLKTPDNQNDILIVTDKEGKAEYKGLAYDSSEDGKHDKDDVKSGTKYYLVEVKAPTGYNLLKDPIAITINSTSYDEEKSVVMVPNMKKFLLPVTGGTGIIIFLIAGVALVGGAGLIIKSEKSKVKAQ